MNSRTNFGILTTIIFTFFIVAWTQINAAEYKNGPDYGPLLQELPKTRISLADGIKQKTGATEIPISAKFELKGGRLKLSVYTAEKGLAVDAEHNVLMEYLGSPESSMWRPDVKIFEDYAHIARSAMYLTILQRSPHSLLDMIQRALEDRPGTVFSVKPKSVRGKHYFELLVAHQGTVVELHYDALAGELIKQ